MSYGRRTFVAIVKFEEFVLSVLLTVMILLACYQIGLRWLTSGGVSWIDPLLRYLVLWSGLLGAVLATARDNHIAMDAAGYLLSKRTKAWIELITRLFCVIVSFFLFRATILFTRSEIEFGGPGLFGLATWIWYLVFPVAFGLILLHFTLDVAVRLLNLLRFKSPDTP